MQATQPQVSAHGRYVAFLSQDSALDPTDGNTAAPGLFVRDTVGNSTRRETRTANGDDATGVAAPFMAASGRYVVWSAQDITWRDLQTGEVRTVSHAYTGGASNGQSQRPVVSNDGECVLFISSATNLVPDDTNAEMDVFLWRRSTNGIERVSVDSTGAQVPRGTPDARPGVSQDCRYITFVHRASLVGGATGDPGVYWRDLQLGTTRAVTTFGVSNHPVISADGSVVVFETSTAFVAQDTGNGQQVYRWHSSNGALELLSTQGGGGSANGTSLGLSVSANGERAVFLSTSTQMPGAANPNMYFQAYLWTHGQGLQRLNAANTSGSGLGAAISADGLWAAVATQEALVPGDTNGVPDVFLIPLP